jgi:8-oxo-dGTP pyrophosphatase MutT (NUDIX family)
MDVVFKTDKVVFNLRVAGIWIENEHVLIHRGVNDTAWSLPGGRIEILEESHESLKREFKEELGIEIEMNRILWSVENFFKYNGTDIHEVGFYYEVSSEHKPTGKMNEPFHGLEGERLIYQWVPIEKLDEIELYPEFLRTKLKDISKQQEHIIVKQ